MSGIMNVENYHGDYLPYWQPDDKARECSNKGCDIVFGLLYRKHHCRNCGKIFCANCWGKAVHVQIYNKEVPVCDDCYDKLQKNE